MQVHASDSNARRSDCQLMKMVKTNGADACPSQGMFSNCVELGFLGRGRRPYVVISRVQGVRRVRRFSNKRRARQAAYAAAGSLSELKGSQAVGRITP